MSEDLCFLTIAQTADLIRRRELSPVELTEAHLIDNIPRADAAVVSKLYDAGAVLLGKLDAERRRAS